MLGRPALPCGSTGGLTCNVARARARAIAIFDSGLTEIKREWQLGADDIGDDDAGSGGSSGERGRGRLRWEKVFEVCFVWTLYRAS